MTEPTTPASTDPEWIRGLVARALLAAEEDDAPADDVTSGTPSTVSAPPPNASLAEALLGGHVASPDLSTRDERAPIPDTALPNLATTVPAAPLVDYPDIDEIAAEPEVSHAETITGQVGTGEVVAGAPSLQTGVVEASVVEATVVVEPAVVEPAVVEPGVVEATIVEPAVVERHSPEPYGDRIAPPATRTPPVPDAPEPDLPSRAATTPTPLTESIPARVPGDTGTGSPAPADRWWARGGIANPPQIGALLDDPVDGIETSDNELLNDAVMVEEDATTEGYRSSDLRTILEWLAVIASALVVALIIKAFVLQAFWIPSESMETTVNRGDRILVNKLSYRLHDVRRGDLVVFEKLPGTPGDTKDLIKRAIALPGETIEIRSDGRIWIWGPGDGPDDALRLEEPYLDPQNALLAIPSTADALATDIWDEACVNQPRTPGRCTLADDQYFMMGDNRNQSSDSRFFGPVPEANIIGRAFFRIWPLGDISTL